MRSTRTKRVFETGEDAVSPQSMHLHSGSNFRNLSSRKSQQRTDVVIVGGFQGRDVALPRRAGAMTVKYGAAPFAGA